MVIIPTDSRRVWSRVGRLVGGGRRLLADAREDAEVAGGDLLVGGLAGDQVLGDEAHDGEHGQAAVVQLLGLVRVPALVRLLDPLPRAEVVTGLVAGQLGDLARQVLDDVDGQEDLEPVVIEAPERGGGSGRSEEGGSTLTGSASTRTAMTAAPNICGSGS